MMATTMARNLALQCGRHMENGRTKLYRMADPRFQGRVWWLGKQAFKEFIVDIKCPPPLPPHRPLPPPPRPLPLPLPPPPLLPPPLLLLLFLLVFLFLLLLLLLLLFLFLFLFPFLYVQQPLCLVWRVEGGWKFEVNCKLGGRMVAVEDEKGVKELVKMKCEKYDVEDEESIDISYSLREHVIENMPKDTPLVCIRKDSQLKKFLKMMKSEVTRLCVSKREDIGQSSMKKKHYQSALERGKKQKQYVCSQCSHVDHNCLTCKNVI